MSGNRSPNGRNGRDAKGKFAKGNPGGPGNPHSKRVGKLRSALLRAIGPSDVADVARKLLNLAKAGDVPAARVLLERLLGPASALDALQELEALRAEVEELTGAKLR